MVEVEIVLRRAASFLINQAFAAHFLERGSFLLRPFVSGDQLPANMAARRGRGSDRMDPAPPAGLDRRLGAWSAATASLT